jgi:hypothetical protein
MGRVGNFLASLQQNRIVTEEAELAARLALGAANDDEINELKNNLKPKQDMKLTELKKMIQAEITKILSEQPETQEKEKVETDTDTKTKPERQRTIGVPTPTPTPSKAQKRENPQPAKEIAEKIAARFKKRK